MTLLFFSNVGMNRIFHMKKEPEVAFNQSLTELRTSGQPSKHIC